MAAVLAPIRFDAINVLSEKKIWLWEWANKTNGYNPQESQEHGRKIISIQQIIFTQLAFALD